MMGKITKDTLIPNELAVKMLEEIIMLIEKYGFRREVIKNGALRALITWEEKHADKSGG
jgi:hypothetical protein